MDYSEISLLPLLLVIPLACRPADEAMSSDGTTANATTATAATTTMTSNGSTDAFPPTTSHGETSTGDVAVTTTSTTAESTGAPVCPAGAVVCDGGLAQVCDGAGGHASSQSCPALCVDGLGCATCIPGELTCSEGQVLRCDELGAGHEVVATCDPLLGLECDAQVGACVGACSPDALGLSYIGCDYYPTVLLQHAFIGPPENVFAVAVSNTADEAAVVTVTRGDELVAEVDVAPAGVTLIELPWIDELYHAPDATALVEAGAYRLRSDRPVTVYQYNPLEADDTNDASLLFPSNTWTRRYLVAAWPSFVFKRDQAPGFYAVVASEDDTTVTLAPSPTGAVLAGAGVAADGTGIVVLEQGDVLQVLTASGADLTGTQIVADRPVQVFGGHQCTDLPFGVAACDHLEESMFPLEALAREYVVVPPVQALDGTLDKGQVVRVIASEDATALTFTPDQPVAKTLALAGDFVELPVSTSEFVVTADKKILVAQYMVGQAGGFGPSDPSMFLSLPPEQWRQDYLVHAPTTWIANYVDLIARSGTEAVLDGVPVTGWTAIAGTDYVFTHAPLDGLGDGNHRIIADQGVSVSIHGAQNSGSYWYPGGLDLDIIAQ